MRSLAPQWPGPAIVVPIERLDRPALAALALALSMSWNVTAFHIDTGTLETERIRERWRRCRDGIALEIVARAPDALGAYLERMESAPVVVVLPFVPSRWGRLHRFIDREARRLVARRDTVVIRSPLAR